MSIDHFVWGEGEHSSDPVIMGGGRGILNVSARPRINLPGRSDRVVKHSHHVSFALITKSLTHTHRSFTLSLVYSQLSSSYRMYSSYST